ncbi:putative mitochondrial protein [Tanacetum coccineum]
MVNTRNNNLVLNTPPPTDPIQAALVAIQETLANIQAEVKAHSTDIASLKRGEGTSQPRRTDELTVQPRPHPEPNNTPYGKLIRIEFPKFSGDDVKDWAVLKTLVWYQQYMKKYPDNTLWEHFEVEVVKRFGVLYDDPIVELKNLKQTGSVQTYQEAFEALLNRVDLPELVAVSMFMGGLKPEVGTPMRMFQATTLSETYGLARMQEATNTILKPRYNTPLLPTPKQSITTYASKAVTTPVKSNLVGQISVYVTRNGVHKPYRLTQRELEEKRAKGQCFYCDQKYAPDGDGETYEDCVGDMVGVTDSPQITLNALSGLNSNQTMRIRGRIGKQVVHILIDCGSTHNFLDIHTAKKLGCGLTKTTPMQVSVANGQRMISTSIYHDLKWSLQNEVFTSDVMLLPLGGCEMVLGIQWLATLRDMQCNFKKLIMKFNHKGRQLVLSGMNNTHVHWMQGNEGMVKHAELSSMDLCVYPVQLCQMESVGSVSAEVEQVLIQFDEVFEVPKDFPPQRSHDHQIPLMPNTPLINVRPYRHPPNQKDAIKGMVKELMDTRVIKASQSPFSSPIVMVKKKDGTWRMCIDYRQLNKHTVKDKFHIPVIEKLIDELNGSVVFSKLDLRTHEGHYEFLVMPFGLTNAPSTFQSLMNTVFKAFLRKFVLVFFDDILIYSKNLKEHCDHLAQVLQLGDIISTQGVSTDLSKIEAMQKWPIPSTLKQLRGFLGLTGYYRRFIKDYASISQPLVALTKKDAFKWNLSAELAYHKLKEAMVQAPMLAPPNFDQEFVFETDPSGKGIRAVLLVAALDKWKGYLLDRHFKIKTDHFSLKYLLNQKLTTPFQFKWLPKLLGYDYEIVYKKKSKNVVVDALSRMDSSREFLHISVSSVSSGVWDKMKVSWKNDLDTQNLIKSLEHHSYKGNKYSWTGEILKRKGKVVVGNDPELRKELVQHFHDEAIGGHSGAHVTMKKLGSLFYWKGLKKMVKQMVRDCDVCQRQKPDLSAYPGLIQPIPIPERIWKEISMDFIEKLPISHGKSVILVVVDRLSKYAHFIPLAHPFIASQVAQVFLDQVYKLHGLPESIVSDRDKIKWLLLAEFWYNTNYHTSTKTTPYEAVYCQTPPIHVPYIPGDSRVEEVDRTLQAREEAIKMLKFHLKRSQDRMRNQANKHRTDRQLEVNDWVYLKLQPHRQVSIRQGQQHKLSSKYYGPFKVAERIGEVAYRLELPSSSQIHPVFHISQLKKCHGKDHSVGVLPQLREDGLLENKPMAILERRLGKVNNKPVMFVLIQWTNKPVEEATWEIYGDLITRFPGFDAVNEAVP